VLLPQHGGLRRPLVYIFIAALVATLVPDTATSQESTEELLARVKELFAAREGKRIVTPLPGSRASVLAADGSSDFFLYVERGSIRGQDTIDTFYERLEAGDMDGAYEVFLQSQIVTLRVSDYGWNGLGVPFTVPAGNEIADVYYRVVDGVFQHAEINEESQEEYLELLRTVLIPALEGDRPS
jgi:hypothetical protein